MFVDEARQSAFRFHHISTDEVYGDLEGTDDLFTETTSYAPSSPYSASKASSDHLVRAWQRTYGLPTLVTNCSNNYGPYHFPEKLIPLMILNALDGKPLPVYGDGMQIRDWLFVEDHARALYKVVNEGEVGETYNIGGHNEKANIEVVKTICQLYPAHKEFKTGRYRGTGAILDHLGQCCLRRREAMYKHCGVQPGFYHLGHQQIEPGVPVIIVKRRIDMLATECR